jgi:hypothetical protein
MKSRLCTALGILAVSSIALHGLWAAEETKTFPEPGSRLPGTFSVLVINGEWKDVEKKPVNRFHAPVTEFGLKPVVLVFVKKGHHSSKDNPEIWSFLKKLDTQIDDNREANLNGCVVFLDHDSNRKVGGKGDKGEGVDEAEDLSKEADVDKLKTRVNNLEKVIKSLKGDNKGTEPLALKRVVIGIGTTGGPKGYKIDSSKVVTVFLYDKFRVKAQYTYKQGELDAKAQDKLFKDIARLLLGAAKKKPVEVEK